MAPGDDPEIGRLELEHGGSPGEMGVAEAGRQAVEGGRISVHGRFGDDAAHAVLLIGDRAARIAYASSSRLDVVVASGYSASGTYPIRLPPDSDGHVTVDNSDWAIDGRLTARLRKDANADVKPYRDYYLEHMWERAEYYDALGQRVMNRPVKHTVLVHFNLLNGLFLNDVLEMFKAKGWQLIDAEEAYTDPVFAAQPKIVPAGQSIIWSLAKEKGTIAKSLRYPAEDGEIENARMNKLGL